MPKPLIKPVKVGKMRQETISATIELILHYIEAGKKGRPIRCGGKLLNVIRK
jgi:acyl-coenzyme A thioesterase PaaI-like protein